MSIGNKIQSVAISLGNEIDFFVILIITLFITIINVVVIIIVEILTSYINGIDIISKVVIMIIAKNNSIFPYLLHPLVSL